jgi:hypothetical protein
MLVAGFKQSSKGDFLVQYEAFQCGVAGAGCVGADCCAVIVLIVFVCCCCCHVGCLLPIAGGGLIVLILVHCCCQVGCLLPIAGGDQGKNKQKNGENKQTSTPVREADADEKGC